MLPRTLIAIVLFSAGVQASQAADWPMWRHDGSRSGATPTALPEKLFLQWAREYTALKPAWPDQEKMQFDIVREPVVAGRMLYLNSSRIDAIRAIDTRSGLEKWIHYADGPIRFAPLAWEGRVYCTSDDGYLYCLDGETGKLLWKFRGGPGDRKILGNERLISTWPARGAPVIADGKIYFAASIWPFMGIFIHALDAKSGEPVWVNDGDGSIYMKQPHNTDSFATIAPQGPIVAIGDKLLIPGGRSIPACFDRKTGKLLRYQLADNGKRGGGTEVAAVGNIFFNGGAVFDLATEKYLNDVGKHYVLTETHVFAWDKGTCRVLDHKRAKTQEAEVLDTKGKKSKVNRFVLPEDASIKVPAVETMILAGDRLYLGGSDRIALLSWNSATKKLASAGEIDVDGTVVRMIAADDRLFVLTREGKLYCYGGQETKPVLHARSSKEQFPKTPPEVTAKAKQILETTKAHAGYGVVWGIGDGQLIEALAEQSSLHLVVIDSDAEKVRRFRDRWRQANIYGSRIAILPGDSVNVQLPPYFATLEVVHGSVEGNAEFLARAYQSLRPYGGTLVFLSPERAQKSLDALNEKKPTNAKVIPGKDFVMVVRDGALPGSANWTHEHADASNTRVSRDVLVKAPMGVLWFGGPPNDVILPRHGHGPQPQVVDGRLIIEGVDLMRAIDIYTGRLLWETKLPGVGFFYNNLAHQPGANASGSNYVSVSDGIYIAYHNKCVRLDPTTGKKISEFPMPVLPGMKQSPRWGYINVVGDYLIGGADPLFDPKLQPPPPKIGDTGDDKEPGEKKTETKTDKESPITKLIKVVKGFSDNMSASRHLVVMDRNTGKVLWSAAAQHSFRHNATCVGGGRLYTIDRLSGEQLAKIKAGSPEPAPARLVAFDLATGKEVWSTRTEIFGTWLSYSEKHDVLFEAGRVARDSLFDEPKGIRAYRGRDGRALWFQEKYTGPAMVHGDMVLQDQGACDLLTGELKMRMDPITKELVPWRWIRNYGCNTPAASEHLLTFRSGAAGYFDLCNDGGTGNFGGFRSSCTNNLIVAGGVLTAPEYTRTCTCAYQNQSSIGLIHMPEAEMWTSFGTKDVKGVVKRLGLNFGAVGDRRSEDGTLWLEYPSIGGVSPTVQVTTKPASPEGFRRHASSVSGAYAWVTSSGYKNVNEISVSLGSMNEPHGYNVKLYFSEPDMVSAGKRVFDVEIEGKKVLTGFDIAAEAGGSWRTIIKEFQGIRAKGTLTIRLTPTPGATLRAPVICGVELIAVENR